MYIFDAGKRKNDVVTFSNNWYIFIHVYDFYIRSKAKCSRKPKHFTSLIDIGVHDFIWSWFANLNK
jgi:hypothetical protein